MRLIKIRQGRIGRWDVNGDIRRFPNRSQYHDEKFDQDGAVYLIYGRSYDQFAMKNPLSQADAVFVEHYKTLDWLMI